MSAPAWTTEEATRRLWIIRELLREHAMDLCAADTALALLAGHDNPRVRSLADATRCEVAIAFIRGSPGGAPEDRSSEFAQ